MGYYAVKGSEGAKAYEEELRPFLKEDEYIVWCGHEAVKEELPKLTLFFDVSAFMFCLFLFSAGAIALSLAVFLDIPLYEKLLVGLFGVIFIIVSLCIPLYVNIRKNRIYAVTNLRAIVLDGKKLKEAGLSEVKKMQILRIRNDINTLRIFTSFELSEKKFGMIEFSNISSASMAEEIIRYQIRLIKNSGDDVESVVGDFGFYKRK